LHRNIIDSPGYERRVKWFRLARLYRIRRTLVDAYRLMGDPLVPLRLKVIVLALAVLILSPLNILGDIPLLGLVDDFALLSLLANWFVRAAGRAQATAVIDADDGALVVR
jgi:uncharacterized membrane protein YkvA (DUF1232 family)